MGNAESMPQGGPTTLVEQTTNYWHGTNPKSEPSLRSPPITKSNSNSSGSSGSNGGNGSNGSGTNGRMTSLPRKSSSFLEEPIVHKLTERGEAAVTLPSSTGSASAGREGSETATEDSDNNSANNNNNNNSNSNDGLLQYAVSEMQGWRSHMEDKHALNPTLHKNHQQEQLLKDHHLFAVFDGHGGDFASQYCGEHLVSTLTGQKDWAAYLKLSNGNNASGGFGGGGFANNNNRGGGGRSGAAGLSLLKKALTSAFLELDASLMSAQRARRLSQLSNLENLVYSMGGSTRHDVFDKGTGDYNRIVNFDKTLPASMPAYVPFERSGSTGVVVLITPDHILCANAGDSRAILSKRSTATGATGTGGSKKEEEPVLPLSFDHKPSNDAELNRVEQDGGFVRAGRVDGDLAVSRSFGDFGYKNCGVKGQKELSPERVLASERRNPSGSSRGGGGGKEKDHRVTVHPDILIHTREPLRDEFIVLACDGIWDRLSNKDCANLVKKLVADEGESDVGLVCEEIIDTALELDSRDNMTCCVVLFPGMTTSTKAAGNSGLGSSARSGLGESARSGLAATSSTNASLGDSARSRSINSANSSLSSSSTGVLRRRFERENSWGDDSTPAKRAQSRLEERKKKNREQLAAIQSQTQSKQRIVQKGAAAAQQAKQAGKGQQQVKGQEARGQPAGGANNGSRRLTKQKSTERRTKTPERTRPVPMERTLSFKQTAPSSSNSKQSSSTASTLSGASKDYVQHRQQMGGRKHKQTNSPPSNGLGASTKSSGTSSRGLGRSSKSLRIQVSS